MIDIYTYAIFSLIFNSSYQYSGPNEIGLDAKMFVYPANAHIDNELMSITFILISPEMQASMAMNDTELLMYAKSTFFATSKSAETFQNRTILGNNSQGEILTKKIPVPTNLEIHLITFSTGEKMCVGFTNSAKLDAEMREKMILEVLNSIKNKQ